MSATQIGMALLTCPLKSAGAASILFPVSVAQQPQNKEAGQQTTARTIATPKPIVGPMTLI